METRITHNGTIRDGKRRKTNESIARIKTKWRSVRRENEVGGGDDGEYHHANCCPIHSSVGTRWNADSGFLPTDSATRQTTRKCDKFPPWIERNPLHAAPTQCPRSCGGLNHIFIYHQPSSSFVTTPPSPLLQKNFFGPGNWNFIYHLMPPLCSVYACVFVIRGNILYERGKLSFVS
jgi:hypothetical protein